MATKPSKIPEWAISDHVDPTSGENNVVEPSAGQKDTGWLFKQKPPRQYFNWLARFTHLWIQFIDDSIDQEVKEGSEVAFKNLLLSGNGTIGNPMFKFFDDGTVYFGQSGNKGKFDDFTQSWNFLNILVFDSTQLDINTDVDVGSGNFTVDSATGDIETQGQISGGGGNFNVDGSGFIEGASLDIDNYSRLGGVESLKVLTFSHTIDAGDISAMYYDFSIGSLTISKIRAAMASGYVATGTPEPPLNYRNFHQNTYEVQSFWTRATAGWPTSTFCRVVFDATNYSVGDVLHLMIIIAS